MLLETYFKHWISILGTPERCPALEQFRLFDFDPPSEHSNGHMKFCRVLDNVIILKDFELVT